MTYFVYLLGNKKKNFLTTYVGYTNNLIKRIELHNTSKGAKFTKGRIWKLMYYEKCQTKSEAMKRENFIKKNRKFRNLIKKKYK
jgi:putative endonuclease